MRSNLQLQMCALKEIISQTDLYLVILSSKNACYSRQNDESLVSLTSYFVLCGTWEYIAYKEICIVLNSVLAVSEVLRLSRRRS